MVEGHRDEGKDFQGVAREGGEAIFYFRHPTLLSLFYFIIIYRREKSKRYFTFIFLGAIMNVIQQIAKGRKEEEL